MSESTIQSMMKWRRGNHLIEKVLVACVVACLVVGCTWDITDVETYVAEVKARPGGPIDEIENPPDVDVPDYNQADSPDPFDSAAISSPPPVDGVVEPPLRSTSPEYLEGFPLDSLRMVGTMNRKDSLFALIKTPDKTVQPVTIGNYMGQNRGKITHVSEASVELLEIVPDGFSNWRERNGSVKLSR